MINSIISSLSTKLKIDKIIVILQNKYNKKCTFLNSIFFYVNKIYKYFIDMNH